MIILTILPALMRGQYDYFNNYYLPPDYLNQNSGTYTNSIVMGDSIVVFGSYYAFSDFYNEFKVLDEDGNTLQEVQEALDENGLNYINFDESITRTETGDLVWGGAFSNAEVLRATCVRYDQDYSREWTRLLDWTATDTTWGAYHCAKEISDNYILAAGRVVYDLNPDPGQDYSRLLIGKYTAQGDSVWEREIPFWDAGVNGTKEFMHINGIFEQANGDILLSGAWLFDWDPFIMRLTSAGEYISHFNWGNAGLNDWLPWCVPEEDGKLMFAYSYCSYYALDLEQLAVRDVRVGLFDPVTMDTLWTMSYGLETVNLFVYNFEKTPDGGYVVMFKIAGDGEPNGWYQGAGAYLLKIDSMGNEEFVKHIPPPIPFEPDGWTLENYGLEVTSDGGYTGVGNFKPLDENYFVAWVWKTDCMGNLALPPISFSPQITQLDDSTFYCTASGDNLYDFHWDFGNGETSEADTLTYSYEEPGMFTITAYGHYCTMTVDSTFTIEVMDCQGNTITPPLGLNATSFAVNDSTFQFDCEPENLSNVTWDFGDENTFSGNSTEHIYLSTGEFEVVVCGEYCDSLFCDTLLVTATVGLHERPSQKPSFVIIPSPTTPEGFEIRGSASIHSVRVVDMIGHEILEQVAKARNVYIREPWLAPGTYLIEVVFGDGTNAFGKLVVH